MSRRDSALLFVGLELLEGSIGLKPVQKAVAIGMREGIRS